MSSPSTRATDTLAPYATASGERLRLKPGLSEEGHAADPAKARHHLGRLLERGVPAALCSHGPVLPDLVALLLERSDPSLAPGLVLSLLHISEPTRRHHVSRMPSSA